MDPFTAIGLAGNVITFIDFGFEVVSAAQEMCGSESGATWENTDLEFLTGKVNRLALNLKSTESASRMTGDDGHLNDLTTECARLSQDLLDLLESLKARSTGSRTEIARAVWRNIWEKEEKTRLEKQLEKCRQLLHLQLTSTARSETLQRLDQVARSSECRGRGLASLQRNVDALRSSLDSKHLSSEDLDQICSLLNLSDQALTTVYQNLVLDGLIFEKMNARFDDVEDAHLNTFSWILEEPDYSKNAVSTSRKSDYLYDRESHQLRLQEARGRFINWLENGNGIFHVSGKPGAGKSTLMKYLYRHHQTLKHAKIWSGKKRLVFTEFFFWRPGVDSQKSLKGLLRGLLHRILEKSPDLIEETFPKQWDSAKYQRRIQFDEHEVQKAFDWIIQQKAVYDKRKFLFFIDGLDEFEGDHGEMIRRLSYWVSERAGDIKICVSSREEPIFQERFSRCPKLRLHELTRHDIAIFVRDTLAANKDVIFAEKELARLQEQIIRKSEGVFLWVSLAVRILEQGLLAENRIKDLEEKIDALPAELDGLFQFIFDSMMKRSHPIDCRNAARTLAMVLNGWYKDELPLIQYSFLEEFLEDPDFAIKRTLHSMSEEEVLQRLRRSRKQIYARCKGFLHVLSPQKNAGCTLGRREIAIFVHRSLAEFLQKKDIQEEMASHLVGFDGFDFYCQVLIAELKSINHNRSHFISVVSRFGLDILGRISAFASSEPPDPARFYGFLGRVTRIVTARVPAEEKGYVFFFLAAQWSRGDTNAIIVPVTDYHPSMHIRFYASQYGLYEYLLRNAADGEVEPRRHREHEETLGFALSVAHGFPSAYLPLDRFLKTLGYCFENGISANSCGGCWGTITCWQRLLWTLVLRNPQTDIPFKSEPLIRVFLLYGADPYFWLRFEPNHGDDIFQGAIRVVPQFGTERAEPFHDIFIDIDSGDIIEFAREKGWTLSLRDIVGYWFPKRAKVLQELIDRNTARQQGDPTEDEVNTLKEISDFDLDVWKGLGCEENEYLFKSFMGDNECKRASETGLSPPPPLPPLPPPPPPTLSFTFSPSLSAFNVPMEAYLSSHGEHDAIVTGAIIFDSRDRLLLLQRASHDTMPNLWEVPGGTCDISDATILHGVAREVWEESGLRVCALSRCVGSPGVFFSRRGLSICKFTFEAQVECADYVRLDPDEHRAYVWASEDECTSRRVEVAGSVVQIEFTARAQEEVVLEAFRARRAGLTPQR